MKNPILAAILLILASATSGHAQTDGDSLAIRTVISEQIGAFRAGDGDRAYSYAAPAIRRLFPSVETFMRMVESGYEPVFRPRSFGFIDQQLGGDKAVQLVDIVGPDGMPWIAMYTLSRQPDGSWKIDSCRLKPGVGA